MTLEEKCRELRKQIEQEMAYWGKRRLEADRGKYDASMLDAYARQGALAAVQRMLDQLGIPE